MKPNSQIKNINPKNESDTHGGSWIDGKWVFGLNKTQLNNSINRKLRFDSDFFSIVANLPSPPVIIILFLFKLVYLID